MQARALNVRTVCLASSRPASHQDVKRAGDQQQRQSIPVNRRSAALFLSSLALLPAYGAKALIPDDDDEELVDLAKSRRKERLANDKKVAKSFVQEGDYSGSVIGKVQNAVNRLAKDGLSLEAGDLKSLAGSSSESWVADLRKAVGDLSKSSAAQQSSGKVLSSLDDLGQAFSGKDIEKAKTSFEGAVTALSKWVSDAGLSQQIKGL